MIENTFMLGRQEAWATREATVMKRAMLGAAFASAFVLVVPIYLTPSRAQDQGRPPAPVPPALVLGLPQAAPEQVGMSKPKLDRIHDVLAQHIADGKLAGTVVLVARKGKLVYADAAGFQDKDEGKPMALDSLFRIYSMTKPLVSVAAMLLVEDGTIQLTDPVSKFFPAFKNQQVSVARSDNALARITYALAAADREMTVQDLLRHTSGLAYGEITTNAPVKDAYAKAGLYLSGVRDYDARDLTPAEEVERLAKAPLAHQPGTVWEYSMAVDLLGRVVEAASGKRLADFLDQRIFKPLQMRDTAFSVPSGKLARVAQPLATDLASGQPIKVIDVAKEPKNDSGGAGAVSTAADYLRFSQMLLNGGQLDGTRIMSRTTVALMTSDHLGARIATPFGPGELLLGTPGYTFGLGFAVRPGGGIAGVPGSSGEFMWAGYAGTYFWVDPKEELTAVYMSQAPSPIRSYYRKLMKQMVYGAISD
jgi:CubicO group peptidase (beta-lactamase class C family)